MPKEIDFDRISLHNGKIDRVKKALTMQRVEVKEEKGCGGLIRKMFLTGYKRASFADIINTEEREEYDSQKF